jgi:hypothetical protein
VAAIGGAGATIAAAADVRRKLQPSFAEKSRARAPERERRKLALLIPHGFMLPGYRNAQGQEIASIRLLKIGEDAAYCAVPGGARFRMPLEVFNATCAAWGIASAVAVIFRGGESFEGEWGRQWRELTA